MENNKSAIEIPPELMIIFQNGLQNYSVVEMRNKVDAFF